MEAEGSSEKSGSLYQTTWHYSLKAIVFTETPVGASGLPREFLFLWIYGFLWIIHG
jgi:hypothetical protein